MTDDKDLHRLLDLARDVAELADDFVLEDLADDLEDWLGLLERAKADADGYVSLRIDCDTLTCGMECLRRAIFELHERGTLDREARQEAREVHLG